MKVLTWELAGATSPWILIGQFACDSIWRYCSWMGAGRYLGIPSVTFISPLPAKWKVLRVICVEGSPMLWAASRPTASPGSHRALCHFSRSRDLSLKPKDAVRNATEHGYFSGFHTVTQRGWRRRRRASHSKIYQSPPPQQILRSPLYHVSHAKFTIYRHLPLPRGLLHNSCTVVTGEQVHQDQGKEGSSFPSRYN